MAANYDTIGVNYAQLRRPDARIAKHIHAALGNAKTVLNVGAGAGSYEPTDRHVTAVEPSAEMIAQRPASAAEAVQASAESLPFADNSFDAAMASLTIHHWTDQAKGCAELRRVTKGPIVFLTFDAAAPPFWLVDYIPELLTLDKQIMPPVEKYSEWLGPVEITPVPIPHDCTDGFLAAYWRRPTAYLDERIRRGISSFWKIGDVSTALSQLESDLQDGRWEATYGHLLQRHELDCGYRLVRTI
ncbi:MAG: class I SAM-dependent methyltransferase [Henriciella sp.]